jgi:hypothetical protein
MKINADLFSSTLGQAILLGVVILIGVGAFIVQHRPNATPLSPAPTADTAPKLPRIFERTGARFPDLSPPDKPATVAPASPPEPSGKNSKDVEFRLSSPLTLFVSDPVVPTPQAPSAPYGRMIPCETLVTLESNRLATPVIGRVSHDIWEKGQLLVPAGTEVHGRAALDRVRERIAVEGSWILVWRTEDATNGAELKVQGLALARESSEETDPAETFDGSAGLPGLVVRSSNHREQRLFAASFLAAATTALQDTRSSIGPWGEQAVPAATLRNATLAGSGAVLRDYAQQIREAIDRDGFFLRVPAGTPFYLYLTERLDLGQAYSPTSNSSLP